MANDTMKEIQNLAALREMQRKLKEQALEKADAFVGKKAMEGGKGAADETIRQLAEASYVRKLKGEQLTPNAEFALKEKILPKLSAEDVADIEAKYANLASDYKRGDGKGLKNFFPVSGKESEKMVKGGMRASTLGAKLGKGAKMLPLIGPMIGLGTALATGDVSAAMPMGLEMDKLGEGSDEVPSEDFVSKEQLKQILDSQRKLNPEEDDMDGVKRPSLNKLRALIDASRE